MPGMPLYFWPFKGRPKKRNCLRNCMERCAWYLALSWMQNTKSKKRCVQTTGWLTLKSAFFSYWRIVFLSSVHMAWDDLIGFSIVYFECDLISRLECLVRVIDPDHCIWIPCCTLSPKSCEVLNSKMLWTDKFIRVHCWDDTIQRDTSFVGLCVQVLVFIPCSPGVYYYHVTIIVQYPFFIGMPDLGDFKNCRHFRFLQ